MIAELTLYHGTISSTGVDSLEGTFDPNAILPAQRDKYDVLVRIARKELRYKKVHLPRDHYLAGSEQEAQRLIAHASSAFPGVKVGDEVEVYAVGNGMIRMVRKLILQGVEQSQLDRIAETMKKAGLNPRIWNADKFPVEDVPELTDRLLQESLEFRN